MVSLLAGYEPDRPNRPTMSADLLAELAHLYFLEATDWNLNHGPRERSYFMKCSRELAERSIKEGDRGSENDAEVLQRGP